MSITSVLRGSLDLIRKEPKLFMPRFVTTALYSVLFVYMAKVSSEMLIYLGDGSALPDSSVARSFLGSILLLMFFMLLLMVVDLVSYAMYPSLVGDYHAKKPVSLVRSLKDAVKAWKVLLAIGLIIILFAALISIVIFILGFLNETNGSSLIYIVTIPIVLTAIMLFLMLLFFIVPVAVVEKKGVLDSFGHGIRLSIKHSRDILVLNGFFLLLTSITFVLLTYTETQYQGMASAASLLLFILVRAGEAVVYTYISVVNPYFYVTVR